MQAEEAQAAALPRCEAAEARVCELTAALADAQRAHEGLSAEQERRVHEVQAALQHARAQCGELQTSAAEAIRARDAALAQAKEARQAAEELADKLTCAQQDLATARAAGDAATAAAEPCDDAASVLAGVREQLQRAQERVGELDQEKVRRPRRLCAPTSLRC